MEEQIINNIKSRQAVVAVIGIGYVGLPIALDRVKAGFSTIGFDINKEKVLAVNSGKSYINDVSNDEINLALNSKKFIATSDFSKLKTADIIEICVPTPLDLFKEPDLSYVKSTCQQICENMRKGQIIIMKSTTYPGTTEELVKPLLEKSGLKCGENFGLGFSPERIDPGNKEFASGKIPQIIGGTDEFSAKAISEFYKEIYGDNIVIMSSTQAAEMTKLLENTFRNVNIALANEMAILCNKMGISIWEVINAAKTKPFGFMAFYPNCGVGGHCIPLDPCYLQWKAKEFDFHTTLIECSTNINDKMCDYCVTRISELLNKNCKSINKSKILFLGITYKENVSDCRESPTIKLINKLALMGADVKYYDKFASGNELQNLNAVEENKINSKALKNYDLVVISVLHNDVDYDEVAKNSKLIFDIKNAVNTKEYNEKIEVL